MTLYRNPAVRIALAGVCVAVSVISAAATSRALTDRPSEEPPANVLALQPEEVRSIAVESAARQVELTRSPDGTWTGVTGAPPEAEGLMSEIEPRLFPLLGYRSLAADASSPEFGLARPEVTMRVLDARGEQHRILLGAATFTNGGVYARRSTDAGRLYLVPRRMMDDFRSLLTGRRVDTVNDLPAKLREKAPKYDPTSWWLRQAAGAGGGQ